MRNTTNFSSPKMGNMSLILLLAFNALILLEAHGFTDETDRQALLEFKSLVSERKRGVLSSWNHSSHFCNWKGVRCGHKQLRVIGLEVGGLQLGGVISPSIGNLSFLVSLDLESNSFGGTIPEEVGHLSRLEYLDMGSNLLGGRIPIGLANCSKLWHLRLASNHLGEGVPSELGSLRKLVYFDLYENNLKGKLAESLLGNLTSLQQLFLASNNLEGEIPSDIAKLTQLSSLQLWNNNFSGIFPPGIYNLSSLELFSISYNNFSGRLRPDFGTLLPNLRLLNVGGNYITGSFPVTLSNISTLERLLMNENNLRGSIPNLGKVENLQRLSLYTNSFGIGSSGDLEFLTSLENCTQLEVLMIGQNRLGGDLPISITNLSAKLLNLGLGRNLISGRIPHAIGNLKNLQRLTLDQNLLSGTLPSSLWKLFRLRHLSLFSNRFSGEIPVSVGNITLLETLDLSNNRFEGIVPPSLGHCSHLQELLIGGNKLNGTIPPEIMQSQQLVFLDMSRNSLIGSMPEDVGQLQQIGVLSVEHNKLSGKLPPTLGNCLTLEHLYLQGNSFGGDIPDIKRLVGVVEVDLSNNNLSGSIPEYLANFSKLEYLNLSFNKFQGRVPMEGIFQNSSLVSISGNSDLCGGVRGFQLKPCLLQEPPVETKHSSHLKKVVIGVSIGITLLLLLCIASTYLIWLRRRKKSKQTNDPTPSTLKVFHEKISYGDIRNATNGFSLSNMVGSGNFGTVFKAFLPTEEKDVAVKVLNLQRRGAMKSFMAECESLKDIRHRNLVKLLTACSSIDFQGNEFRALIYEYMPNGNLDMWLHQEEEVGTSRTLTLLERLNIAIDVASVLDYLHVHCHKPIAHCDLKPSNILLDDDLTAHVSDFGLAHLLLEFDKDFVLNQLSSAGVRGTIGYAPPEYGMGGQPSINGDVYSFGILLLEMFTGKRPTDDLFEGDITLKSYTKLALPESVLDIADKSILHSGLRLGFKIAECLTLILEVGLRCCEDFPPNRLATSEVAKELISIREMFFKTIRTATH